MENCQKGRKRHTKNRSNIKRRPRARHKKVSDSKSRRPRARHKTGSDPKEKAKSKTSRGSDPKGKVKRIIKRAKLLQMKRPMQKLMKKKIIKERAKTKWTQ